MLPYKRCNNWTDRIKTYYPAIYRWDGTTALTELKHVTLRFTDYWDVTIELIELKHVTLQFTDKWDVTTKLVELKHVTLQFTDEM